MKNHNTICIFIIVLQLLSCIKDNDFDIPVPENPEDPATGITANITIAEVKAIFSGFNTVFVSDLIMEGYVVSSDASGNFYKELYLQDNPSAPTAGIRLVLDKNTLYLTYDIGRKIMINLRGLTIGKGYGNVLTIGQQFDNNITGISTPVIQDFVIRSATIVPIIGKPMIFSQITDQHIGLYVSVSKTQISNNDLGLPFADSNTFFDTRRHLKSCEEETSFILETSAFADFKQLIIPNTSGTISGIVTKDFLGDTLVLVLNEAHDMIYDKDRCDTGSL